VGNGKFICQGLYLLKALVKVWINIVGFFIFI